MRVKVTVDVDVEAWAVEYGIDFGKIDKVSRELVRQDVEDYICTLVYGSAAGQQDLVKIATPLVRPSPRLIHPADLNAELAP